MKAIKITGPLRHVQMNGYLVGVCKARVGREEGRGNTKREGDEEGERAEIRNQQHTCIYNTCIIYAGRSHLVSSRWVGTLVNPYPAEKKGKKL